MKSIFIGNNALNANRQPVTSELVERNGESMIRISNNDLMRPFLMSLASGSNHWMFISSNGGLTAGRKDADHALFPYVTDDKLTENAESTGSKTIIRLTREEGDLIWYPFSDRYDGLYSTRRNLYKSIYGDQLVFEEINESLGLTFSYKWSTSNEFGFIRTSELTNNSENELKVELIDGIQNIMPHGVSAEFQNARSNLVDAYKRSELNPESGIGVFALSAIIVDKAEPSEALKANTVWSYGAKPSNYLLSSRQLGSFVNGEPLSSETDVKAEKGAYLVHHKITLKSGATETWKIVANVNQSAKQVVDLENSLKRPEEMAERIDRDVLLGRRELVNLCASSDGLQVSRDALNDHRHFANTLFNIMRGGVFDHNYQLPLDDFRDYLNHSNRFVFENFNELSGEFEDRIDHHTLIKALIATEDSSLIRLAYEYLPLKFSRRHGDPSRPWNRFSIETKSEVDGSELLRYEGNWRDIFQNWEALAVSFPAFIPGMIFRFLNASTFDGYNPYRIEKNGIDWEVIEPNDPWSYIGYWGDHQLIYLLKFLEFCADYFPEEIRDFSGKDWFVYANVPYRIKTFNEILKNPKDTILFDEELDRKIRDHRIDIGSDGALLADQQGKIHQVNFIEKILATLLSKISNFIPGGGIWMNTQRPEWNDANNALVGNGISVVTLCYLRRFVGFMDHLLDLTDKDEYSISEELYSFFQELDQVFVEHKEKVGLIDTELRLKIVTQLGQAGSNYRETIYAGSFSGNKKLLVKKELVAFFELVNQYVDESINQNERNDKLYHAYNLLEIENENRLSIGHLPLMLEGQVAALSSGLLNMSQAIELLDHLEKSDLYREDQGSYLLYPDKVLSGFMDKNTLSHELVQTSELLTCMLSDGCNKIIEQDSNGDVHFNGDFKNANDLKEALSELEERSYGPLIEKDSTMILDEFERIFDHKSFTGRSMTFFGYEGLGSIYWHMVSKLGLAVQEFLIKGMKSGIKEDSLKMLNQHYFKIKEGIGVHKSPELYGAFPTDPYSHTPANKGAQQPGMTGQVKEDILCRYKELGVYVTDGQIEFLTDQFEEAEFLTEAKSFSYMNMFGEQEKMIIPEGAMAFTLCQVPVIYRKSNIDSIEVNYHNNARIEQDTLRLSKKISEDVFYRKGGIKFIIVNMNLSN